MFLDEIEIENYKCFGAPVVFRPKKGLNLVIGKNNAGKTTLLEAISLEFLRNPYTSIETYPESGRPPDKDSKVRITFTLQRNELLSLLFSAGDVGRRWLRLPIDRDYLRYKDQLPEKSYTSADAFRTAVGKMLVKRYFQADEFTFKLERVAYGGHRAARWNIVADSYVKPELIRSESDSGRTQHYTAFTFKKADIGSLQLGDTIQVNGGDQKDDFILAIMDEIERITTGYGRYIYRFQAERTPKDSAPLSDRRRLAPDASNLPEVLHYHLSNLALSKRYNRLITSILPDVKQVTVVTETTSSETKASIRLWTDNRSVAKHWLSRPLSDMGSGVAQVLAIIYVLVFCDTPQLILIDEPQSFLHPDASRKLIEVLTQFGDKHQVIMTTHTPSVVAAAIPSSVTLVRLRRGQAGIQPINIQDIESQRLLLGDIGARLSDVFGYDKILWVEGVTEEICFPRIIRTLSTMPNLGTAILGVHATGDFDQRNAKDVDRIVGIYERLSQAKGGLVPDAVAYIFDREERSPEEIADKKRRYPNVQFLDRRMFECYLLYPEAIVDTIKNLEPTSDVTVEAVEEWLTARSREVRYFRGLAVPDSKEDWRNTIHAKRLFKDLFKKFCKSPFNQVFKARVHSAHLTLSVLNVSPERLRPLADILEGVLK